MVTQIVLCIKVQVFVTLGLLSKDFAKTKQSETNFILTRVAGMVQGDVGKYP